MTAVLSVLFGRLPIGWLQLVHNRTRLAAAIAGVAFANILVLVQLGFLGALNSTIVMPYNALTADIMISASDTNTLTDGSNVPRQRMYQALSVPGVASATPLYLGSLDWNQKDGGSVNFQILGVDPARQVFNLESVNDSRDALKRSDVVLVDSGSRGLSAALLADLDAGKSTAFEAANRTLTAAGTFVIGAGFGADGYMITSDQTFARLFPNRVTGAPNHILVDVDEGANAQAVVDRLRTVLPERDVIVRTVKDAGSADQTYQTTERPTGLIFGFGIVIGVLVGIIILYQILSTDVADHLKEYATLKAVGYKQRFFNGIVFEEAMILALFGFIPGLLISLGLYYFISGATGLPMVMSLSRAISVLAGSFIVGTLSGMIATRRLAGADPADLF